MTTTDLPSPATARINARTNRIYALINLSAAIALFGGALIASVAQFGPFAGTGPIAGQPWCQTIAVALAFVSAGFAIATMRYAAISFTEAGKARRGLVR